MEKKLSCINQQGEGFKLVPGTSLWHNFCNIDESMSTGQKILFH